MDIQINKIGLILEGNDKGWYVRIEDDTQNTGGYLIHTFNSLDLEDIDRQGFDSWVESIIDLEAYFQESSWKVKWFD